MSKANCFKVVYVKDDCYYSYFTRICEDFKEKLQYEVGKPTRPKIGKIFCFAEMRYVNEFLRDESVHKNIKLFEAEADSLEKATYCGGCSNDFEDFWMFNKSESWVPEGTYFCNELTLIKEIPLGEYYDNGGI